MKRTASLLALIAIAWVGCAQSQGPYEKVGYTGGDPMAEAASPGKCASLNGLVGRLRDRLEMAPDTAVASIMPDILETEQYAESLGCEIH